jgi:hypothetical protein
MAQNNVAILLEHINKNPNYLKLLNQWPQNEFFDVKNWPSVQRLLTVNMVFWLHRKALTRGKLIVRAEKSFKIPMGDLHYVLSDTLSIGYLIELPKTVKLEVTPTYINAIRGKVGGAIKDTADLPVLSYFLRDKHLCGFELNSTIMITCQTDKVDFLI